MASSPSHGNRAGIGRLARAFALFDVHGSRPASPSTTDADFLEQHAEYRDILEPLLDSTRATASTRPATRSSSADAERPETIGPYRVLADLGEGGMGVVYLAEQTEPIHRRVAVKLVRTPTPQAIARFDAERQALARMQHPNIARVLDAGETEVGRLPWFAMEYVGGRPLLDYVRQQQLDLPARLRLFAQICDGVHHAHQKAVLHRDLKASNVLVVSRDGESIPVVIDFGIAKALGDSRLTERTIVERTGHLVGTPECMAPEQIEGRPEDLDVRTDVYALGLLLYRLASGLPAFEFGPSDTVRSIEKTIREQQPVRPSLRLANCAAEAAADVAQEFDRPALSVARDLRGDVDWICLTALEKEPDRRYSSAWLLGEDVRRLLRFEPVIARPPTLAYLTRRLFRRRRGFVAAITAVVLALLSGLGTALWQRGHAIRSATAASSARTEYDRLANFVRLERARSAAVDLRPAHPHKLDAIRAWREQHAEPLMAVLPVLREAKRDAAARGVPSADEGPSHFDRPEDEFLHHSLTRLVDSVADFESGLVATIAEREQWAATVGRQSIDDYAIEWRAAAAAIRAADGVGASVRYQMDSPFELVPQVGLVPIGKNPVTGLWEFYHLRSAAEGSPVPASVDYDELGVLSVGEGTGIVFVLIPGGTFFMGSQDSDELGVNYDAGGQSNEQPVREVELAPFFLARHELTQGQWIRLGREGNPSDLAGKVALDYPVESVGWSDCRERMLDHGLTLPTEAQWEYACRAGTTTPWWTGIDRDSLRADGLVANLADQSARALGANWTTIDEWPGYHDGIAMYGAAGGFRPNAWGLHHVHGNVFEWCLDAFLPYSTQPRLGDGLRVGDTALDRRVARGGSFNFSASVARSANRHFVASGAKFNIMGLRAARLVEREPSLGR